MIADIHVHVHVVLTRISIDIKELCEDTNFQEGWIAWNIVANIVNNNDDNKYVGALFHYHNINNQFLDIFIPKRYITSDYRGMESLSLKKCAPYKSPFKTKKRRKIKEIIEATTQPLPSSIHTTKTILSMLEPTRRGANLTMRWIWLRERV